LVLWFWFCRFADIIFPFLELTKKLIQDFREETPLFLRYFRFVRFVFCLGVCFVRECLMGFVAFYKSFIVFVETKRMQKMFFC